MSVPGVYAQSLAPGPAFATLDAGLPLALLPVRLEARFLPAAQPTEIVVRVFPDTIHADAHDPALTDAELALAQSYWDAIWRAGGDAAAVAAARDWLAAELGLPRAVYIAWATRPHDDPPAVPSDAAILRAVAHRDVASPSVARLLPARWAAFVEAGTEVAGPFWAASSVAPSLPIAPALVDLPENADARTFLSAQGLDWTHDLTAAETAGMVVRVPIAGLPARPQGGYDRLIVLGAAAGSEHGDALRALLDAHRYTRGLDVLPPGTPTNVTDGAPDGAGTLDAGAVFDAEFARRGVPPVRPPRPGGAVPAGELLAGPAADALRLALGMEGETALDRALAADDPSSELARAANEALWPSLLGAWFTGPMSLLDDGSPLIVAADVEVLRRWFIDHVRAEGPLPTLRVGRDPYGLLPTTVFGQDRPRTVIEHLEAVALDLYHGWKDDDAVAVLDPDAGDAPPASAAEQASDVGAIYGATPHLRELRLRPVEDTGRDLADLYTTSLGFAGLLCALVPDRDGEPFAPEDLDRNAWYQIYLEHEDAARGSAGVDGQLDALQTLVDDLQAASGTPAQETAELSIRAFIDRFTHDAPDDAPTADLFGMAARHSGRVADAQPYLAPLGVRDALGVLHAPRLYGAGYGEEGTEVTVGELVAPGVGDDAVAELSQWLGELHDAVSAFAAGGQRPAHNAATPVPLLRQLLQAAASNVPAGAAAGALRDGLDRLHRLVESDAAAAIGTLERLMRGCLGLAVYRVDAWMTGFATERLQAQRSSRSTGLQVGGYGWLEHLEPRAGRPSQGHIHAPSLDHATTAAVLRSGWSAFGTAEAGSPLTVDVSAARIRAARALIEGVRGGQELGRQLGARFERRLHDRHLDAHLDDVRAAVLTGSGAAGHPPTRVVDGLLLARAYTDGIERTPAEQAVRVAVDPIVSATPAVHQAVLDTVSDLDAVADLLFGQAVHALLRGDAGVAAPTLAATGSGDAGLPAIDFPQTRRGERLVTVRVIASFGAALSPATWPGAAGILGVTEPRLERFAGVLLGEPGRVVAEVGGARVTLDEMALGALDAVYGADDLGARVLASAGASDGALLVGRPDALTAEEIAFDDFLVVARALRDMLGSLRALTAADLTDQAEEVADARDAADLRARLDRATALLAPGDPRHALLDQHRAEHPGDTPELLLERLRIITVVPLPILPLLETGVPATLAASFGARDEGDELATWLAQAAKVRPGAAALVAVSQPAELLAGRPLLDFAAAQLPDAPQAPWAATREPAGGGSHTAWCSVTGAPPAGPVAGFVADAWTETIPDTQAVSGIAAHFDRPSAAAPNAVLLAVTRAGDAFDLDYVRRCIGNALDMAHFRALSADHGSPFLGQFLPAVLLPGDTVVSG